MAKRRGIGAALQTASGSINSIIDAYIKQALQEESQLRQGAITLDRQKQLENLQFGNAQLGRETQHKYNLTEAGFKDPDAAERTDAVSGVSMVPFRRTQPQRMQQVQAKIAEGKDPQTAIGPEQLRSLETSFGVNRPDISALLGGAATERAGNIEQEELNKENRVPRIGGPDNTLGFRDRSGAFVPTERSGGQQGLFDLQKYRSGEGSAAYTLVKADAENMLRSLTRDERNTDDYNKAYNTEAGGIDARVASADDLVGLEGRLASARAAATKGDNSAMVAPLLAASSEAFEAEKQGAVLNLNTIKRATSPMIAAVGGLADAAFGPMTHPTDLNANYAQSAVNYAATVTKMMSGVQSRADERDIFLTNNFVWQNDTPAQKAKKAAARSIFTAAVMAEQGPGGKFAAGQVIGRAIIQGLLPPDSLPETLDPEFERGVRSTSGAPPGVAQ